MRSSTNYTMKLEHLGINTHRDKIDLLHPTPASPNDDNLL